jgi:hypothetical protein
MDQDTRKAARVLRHLAGLGEGEDAKTNLMHAAKHDNIYLVKAKSKNPHAAALGKLGGIARRKATTKTQRSAIARKAAKIRWSRIGKG